MEGRRGEPTVKPPYPSESGYKGYPTNVNNVETYANIPPIILRGAEWFSSIGTEKSKGTKVFALAGKVNNVGLIEVPMGTTLREVIFEIGGGIKNGKKFKAVQIGGPSGGCLTEEHLDYPMDFDSLKKLGAIIGPDRLRQPAGKRIDDGFGRHDRHGRRRLHGVGGQILPRIHRR